MSTFVTGSDYSTTQLVASTNQSATTLIVADPTEPFPAFDATHTYFYETLIDEPSYIADANPPAQREIVKVTAYIQVSEGWQLTCVRGVGGTSPQIWAVGSVVELRPCAQWFEDLKGGTGGSIAVTDGITTVDPASVLNFTSGATVTDGGGGEAQVTISGSGGAPTDATYVTMSLNSTLTNERVLTAGTGISLTDGGANSTATVANTLPMVQAEYVVVSASGSLSSERVLTAGTNITLVDGGANSTLTINASGGGAGGASQSEEFTANGNFTVPAGVTLVWLTEIGGGAGGGGTTSGTTSGSGGGGSGEQLLEWPIIVNPTDVMPVVVGAKGVGGTTSVNLGTSGGSSSFGGFTVAGGVGGFNPTGGIGGGVRGGAAGAVGTAESPKHFGGSGGGGGGSAGGIGSVGGGSGGFTTGGAGGAVASTRAGGGGGAASPYGNGGAGGAGQADGVAAASTSYGAGGGGAGAFLDKSGGDGCAGYVLIEWIG